MTIRILVLCCSIGLLVLPLACTEAGRCELGERDCEPRANDRCGSGLHLENGLCVCDPGDEGCEPDEDGDCESGTHEEDGVCVVDDEEPPPDEIDCPEDSLDEACQIFCEAYCQNQETMCVESRCSPGDCDPGSEFVQACATECDDDADCARDLCLTQIDIECTEFGYTEMLTLDDGSEAVTFVSLCGGDDPVCVPGADIGCSNLCGTTGDGVGAELVGNGLCEDGGEGSVSPDSPLCNRGTDCSDCGVRVCAAAGESCGGHGDCCGYYDQNSFCVLLDSGGTCLETCTETGTCPDDLRCLLVDDEENRVCAP